MKSGGYVDKSRRSFLIGIGGLALSTGLPVSKAEETRKLDPSLIDGFVSELLSGEDARETTYNHALKIYENRPDIEVSQENLKALAEGSLVDLEVASSNLEYIDGSLGKIDNLLEALDEQDDISNSDLFSKADGAIDTVRETDSIKNARKLVPVLFSLIELVRISKVVIDEYEGPRKLEEETMRKFYLSLMIVLVECASLAFGGVPYKIAFRSTRVLNWYLVRYRSNLGMTLYVFILKEAHWGVRGAISTGFGDTVRNSRELVGYISENGKMLEEEYGDEFDSMNRSELIKILQKSRYSPDNIQESLDSECDWICVDFNLPNPISNLNVEKFLSDLLGV